MSCGAAAGGAAGAGDARLSCAALRAAGSAHISRAQRQARYIDLMRSSPSGRAGRSRARRRRRRRLRRRCCGRARRGIRLRFRRWLHRRKPEPLAQLRNPAIDGFFLARELLVLLEGLERTLRVIEIEIADHAEVPPRGCVMLIGTDRLLVGSGCLLELPAQALRDAELAPGDGAAALALGCALESLLRRLELPGLALQEREVDQRRGELRVLQGHLFESELRLSEVAGTHVVHRALEIC